MHYDFNGKLLLYPGDLISAAMSTAVSTSSSVDLGIRWAEWQLPA
jgi:hypothetical protein